MTVEQLEEVLAEAPQAKGKAFTLKSFAARQAGREDPVDYDVADPLGMSEAGYRAIAREIEGLIDDVVPALTGGRLAREA
jgi:hypothetical protein